MKRNSRSCACWSAVCGVLIVLAGCKEDVDPAAMGEDSNIEALEGCGTLTPPQAVDLATGALSSLLHDGVDRIVFLNEARLLQQLLGGDLEDGVLDVEGLHEAIDGLVETLEQRVLLPEFVESQDGPSVTYHLIPESYCSSGGDDIIELEASTNGDHTDCVERMTATPVRLELTRVHCDQGDTVRVRLLLGTEPTMAAAAVVSAERIELVGDVAAWGSLASSSDATTIDAAGAPALRLALVGASGLELEAELPDGVRWNQTGDQGSSTLSVGDSPEALRLSTDALTGMATGSFGLFGLTATSSLRSFVSANFGASSSVDHGDITTTWPVLQGAFTYDTQAEHLAVQGLRYAQEVRYEGDTIFSVTSSEVQATAELDADNAIRVEVAEGFELTLDFALAPVAPLVENLPPFASADKVTISAEPSTVATLLDDSSGTLALWSLQTGPLLRLEAGSVTLSSQSVPDANLVVNPGECLLQLDTMTHPHELHGDMAAGPCDGE